MLRLNFPRLRDLNFSLQVGDAVYARGTETQPGADDAQAGPTATGTGSNHYIGVLRKIDNLGQNQGYDLHVDNEVNGVRLRTVPQQLDFIMFSKFSQGDSGVLGYYAEAKFVNESKHKAELFAVSSEIIINSK